MVDSEPTSCPMIQRVIAVMWPSFLVAGVATILFFTAFDPQLIVSISGYGDISRLAGYTIGFFLFWGLAASSCALTCYFQKPCKTINQSNRFD